MKISEKQIKRLIRESLYGKRIKTLNENIVKKFMANAKELGGQIADTAKKYASKLADAAALHPGVLIFSSLMGCSSDGKFDKLSERHFVWWYNPSTDSTIQCTCEYTDHEILIASNYEGAEPLIAHILEWPSNLFGEFASGESIFYKSNFNGGNADRESVEKALDEYEKNPDSSDLKDRVLTNSDMDALNRGASLIVVFDGTAGIARVTGIPSNIYGSVKVGMTKDDIVNHLKERDFVITE